MNWYQRGWETERGFSSWAPPKIWHFRAWREYWRGRRAAFEVMDEMAQMRRRMRNGETKKELK